MDETYKLMSQDKIHFYCGRCDKVAGKLLKTVLGIQTRQMKMEGELHKVKEDVAEMSRRPYVIQEQLDEVVQRFESGLKDVKQMVTKGNEDGNPEEQEIQKLQTELDEMKKGMRSQLDSSAKELKDEMEESLEIECRKMNLVIHGLKDENGEVDVEEVIKLFDIGLKMDYERHVEKITRIGRTINEQKIRPLKMVLKSVDSRKEILARAKILKESEEFTKVFITPDLTRRQQEKDKILRQQLKKIREEGEPTAKIKNGKVVKNLNGLREVVLYQPSQ